MTKNVKWNQIYNFISSSGSGTVINYGSGSHFLTSYGYGSGSGSGSTTLLITLVHNVSGGGKYTVGTTCIYPYIDISCTRQRPIINGQAHNMY